MTIFAIVLGLIYLLVGVAKIAGVPQMRESFDEFGLGRQGMLAVGGLEVAAAVGLQIDALETWAALGMVLMMVGAVAAHVRAKHSPDQLVPAAVVLIASAVFLLLSI